MIAAIRMLIDVLFLISLMAFGMYATAAAAFSFAVNFERVVLYGLGMTAMGVASLMTEQK